MMKLQLREATSSQEDYSKFEEMYKNFRYAEIDGKMIPRSKLVLETKEKYMHYIDQEGNVLFIVEECSGNIVGYFIMAWYEDGGAKINEMHIVESCQRKGYGKKAVKELISLVKEEGFKWIELMSYSIATDNFWSACNFRYIGRDDQYEFHIK